MNTSLSQVLRQTAIFGEKRHDVLVGNVANLDTPTYKTRDLDTDGFQKALEHTLRKQQSTSPGTLSGSYDKIKESEPDWDGLKNPILAAPRNITFQDGNNRSIEQEMAELSKNMLKQSLIIQVLMSQYSQLETVVSERI